MNAVRYLAIVAALAGTSAAAQVRATDSSFVLDTIVVSATKGPPGRTPPQPVTVITGAELRATGLTRVPDALRAVAGATVAVSGSPGAVASLFLRGGESRYTKVLIDGVPVNAVGGYFDFSHLTTDNVDRIEVVRGPASVVFGADAMSGVVQIFTRRGADAPTIEAGARAGTYGTRELDASLSGSRGVRYSLAGALRRTDGSLPYNNRYYNGTLSAAVRAASARLGTADISARYTDAEFHYPTDFDATVNDSNSYRDQHRLVLALDATRRVAPRVTARVIAGSNYVSDVTDDIEKAFVCAPSAPCDEHTRFTSRTRRRNAELRATVDLPRATWTTGVEYVRERERSVGAAGPLGGATTANFFFSGTRTTRTGFSELRGDVEPAEYTLSARLDDPSDFERFATHRLAIAAPLGPVRLRAATGTAFNAPSFFQLLPTPFTTGSPDLDPERTRSVEGGIDLTLGPLKLSATHFGQSFRDLIQFVPGGPPLFQGSYANLAGARSRGTEVEVRANVRGWVVDANGAWLDAKITELDARYSGPLTVGERLIRRARRTASVRGTYLGWARGSLGVAARYVGPRDDLDFRSFPAAKVGLAAYTVLDVSAAWRIPAAPALTLTGRVENALDEEYQEVFGYDAPGRTVLVGLRFGVTR